LVFVFGSIPISIYIVPVVLDKIKHKIRPNTGEHLEMHDEVMLFCLFSTAILLSYLSSLFSSPLLGMFTTGVLYCKVISTHKVWKHQIKRIYHWLKRIFFSASIGFSIPVKSMVSARSFGLGFLLSAIGGICGKLLPCLILKENKFLVGWAMAARGEFGFLMANTYYQITYNDSKVFSEKNYSIVLWSLMITCFTAPLIFQQLIKRRQKQKKPQVKRKFSIRIFGERHHSMQKDLKDALENMHLELTHLTQDNKEGNQVEFVLKVSGGAKEEEIRDKLQKALGDNSESIIFEDV